MYVYRFHSLLRPSFSVPTALGGSPKNGRRLCRTQMSLSSLKAIVYDELGVSLVSTCMYMHVQSPWCMA